MDSSSLQNHVSSSRTLADKVFDSIQTAIVKGQLVPGQKLNENDLSAAYGVSRGPLREAIRRLEGRGLVVKRPHAGISVVSLKFEELMEIYQVREALEGMACRLAAMNMEESEIEEIRQLLELHEKMIEEDEGRSYYQREGDFDFHYRIVKGARNSRLYQMLCGELYHLVRMYRYRLSLQSGRARRALREHVRIFEAIEDRDSELAEILMRRHIGAARESIRLRYENDGFEI